MAFSLDLYIVQGLWCHYRTAFSYDVLFSFWVAGMIRLMRSWCWREVRLPLNIPQSYLCGFLAQSSMMTPSSSYWLRS
jgi:hypothetical protein